MRRNVDQSTRTIQLPRFPIEPIYGRVDEHPFVLIVFVEEDHSETFAEFKLLRPYASCAAAEAAEIHLRLLTDTEIEPDVRSAVRVGG